MNVDKISAKCQYRFKVKELDNLKENYLYHRAVGWKT